MKKAILILLLLLIPSACFAANLDQSMDKPVTLKTEIQRGYSAISSLNSDNAFDFLKDVTNVTNYNKQNNKDTDGFYLGMYFKAWIKMDMLLSYKMYSGNDEFKLANSANLLYYNEFRKLQAKYNVDDITLCDTCDLNYDKIKPYFDKWWSKTHPNE